MSPKATGKNVGRSKAQKVRGRRRTLLLAAVLPLLVIVAWVIFTGPQTSRAATEQAKLEEAQSLLDQFQGKLSALLGGETPSAAALLVTARQLDQMLPPTVSPIAVVNQVTGLAAASGVTLQEAAPVTGEDPSFKQVTVVVNGSRNSVAQFLTQLQAASPLMTITDLQMAFAVPNPTDPTTTTTATDTGQTTTTGPLLGDTTASFTLNAWFHPDATLDDQIALTGQANGTAPSTTPQVAPAPGAVPSAQPVPGATPSTPAPGELPVPAPEEAVPAPSGSPQPAPAVSPAPQGSAVPVPVPVTPSAG